MDNANKIAPNLTHKEVALFLGDDLHIQNDESITTYNLVDEYAKTRKHYKPFVWVLLAICFFIVGAGTFTTIGLLSNSNKRIAINIDSFDDLNLRSLLSSAGRVQNLYENAIKNKAALEDSLENELTMASQKRDNDFFTLQSVASVATAASISERKARIELEYNETVQDLHEHYDPQILEAEEEIRKYKTQVEKYDESELSQAQSEESSIDSTKQLHDIEMRTQADRYEKKLRDLRAQLATQQIKAAEAQKQAVEEVRKIYQAKIDLLDPKAREESNEQNKIILDAGIENQLTPSTLWKSVEGLSFDESSYTSQFKSPSLDFINSLRTAQNGLEEIRTIAYRFKPIPMENSIKDYVPAMMHQTYQIADELAKGSQHMQAEIDELRAELTERNDFLENYVVLNNCDGIILSTHTAPSFSVYVAKASRLKISAGSSVSVSILNGNKIVANATVAAQGSEFVLTQTMPAQEPGKKAPEVYQIQTGDKFRIDVPKVK